MKKFIVVMAAVVFCMAATQAQKWVAYAEVIKNDISAGPIIQGMKENFWFGNFHQIRLTNNGSFSATKQLLKDSNIIGFKADGMYFLGEISFEDSRSYVYDAVEIEGETYICAHIPKSVFQPRLMKLNKNTKMFEALPFEFDQRFKFHYLGNGKVLLFGDFYEGKDKNGTQVLNGACIWDISQNTIGLFSGSIMGSSGYQSHSVGTDGTIFINNQGGLRILHYGVLQDKTFEYPRFITAGQFRQIVCISKESAYAVWRRDSDGIHFLLRLRERKWDTLGQLSYPPVTTTSSVTSTQPFVVHSMVHYKGKIVMTHSGSTFNDQPVNQIFAYDTLTGQVQNLPVPLSRTNFKEAYVKVLGDSLYFVTTHEWLFGTQRVYVLEHDGTLPVKLSDFSGKEISHQYHEIFWKTQSEDNVSHFEIQASPDGSTFSTISRVNARNTAFSYKEKVVRTWHQTFYRLKMVDKDGAFEYSKVITVGGSSEKNVTLFPNPLVGNTLRVEGVSPYTQVVIIGVDGRIHKTQVISSGQTLDVSSLARGTYFLRIGEKSVPFVK